MKRTVLGTIKNFFNNLKKNRVLYSLFVTLVAFNLVVISSFAWLTLNRKAGVGEMGMSLAVDDTNAVYQAYMYDLKTGKGTDKNAKGETLNITNIDLNQYDTIFKGQNKYTPVFAKIILVRNQSMPLKGTVHITVEREDSGISLQSLTPFSSSIVRFTTFIMTDKSDINITDPELLYDHISTLKRFNEIELYSGNERTNSKTFVSVNGEGVDHTHSKSNALTISVDYEDTNWYKNSDNHDALNVYLYITYDVQLVECYMDENTGGGLSLDDNSVFFENDMKKVSVSYSAR